MFNQLDSSNRQKRLKRGDIYNQFLKQRKFIDMDSSLISEDNRDYLRQKQQMIYSQLSSNSAQNQERNNLSSIIKYKLQSKKVQLPSNLSNQMRGQIEELERQKIEPIIINNYLSRSSKYDSVLRSKKRVKTYQQEDSESEEQNKKYKKALKEIDDLNQLFFKNNRKRQARLTSLISQSPKMRRDFNHISRQKEFERYISHLDRLSSLKSQQRKQPYRLDTSFKYKPKDNDFNYKRLPQISPRKTEETSSIIKNPPNSSLQSNTNDTFIKILKKVKARGESLLVKLNKFPSLKHMSK